MNNQAILNITFDARIKDGLIKREAEYKPIMSAPNAYKIYNNIKWFQSGLINNKDLDEAMGTKLNKQGRQMVFLNIQQFNSYVKFMSGKEELSEEMKNDLSKSGGIIEKNISYLLETFFGNKSSLYLGDKEYTIQGYEWDRTFTPVGDGTPKNIKLRFLLSEGKEKGFMKSVEVSCAQKWDSIKNDFAFLTGFKSAPLELKEYEKNPYLSNEQNAAEKKQWDEDNKVENDAITEAWKAKNEQDKANWKNKRATNEKDAPYTKIPRDIDPSLLPIAQPIPLQATNVYGQAIQGQAYVPGQAQAPGQVQAALVRAKSAKEVENIRAKAIADEAEKKRQADAVESQKERDAKAVEAEKQRLEVERLRLEKAAEAEKERVEKEAADDKFKKRIDRRLFLINEVKKEYNEKIKNYEGRLTTGKLEADEEIKNIKASTSTRIQKETSIQKNKMNMEEKEELLETLKINIHAMMEIDRNDLETDFDKYDKIYTSARDTLKKVDERSTSWTIKGKRRSERNKNGGGSSKRRTRKKKHKIKMSK